MMKTLALLLLTISFSANAVIIPPATSSKGYGESNYSTTFGFDFQYFPITRSGSKATLGVLRVDGGGTGTGTAFTQGSVLFAGASGVYSQNNSNFFWDNSNTRLGLGLTAPTSKLHVDGGNATASAIKMTAGTTTGQASTDGYEFGIDSSGNGEIRQREALEVRLFTNNTQRVTVQSGGNVGIGTNNPLSKLEVSGNIGLTSPNSTMVAYRPDVQSGTLNGSNVAYYGMTVATGDFSGTGLFLQGYYGMSLGTAGVERMRITSTGNVGIGTSSVEDLLHVSASGGNTFQPSLRLANRDNTNTGGSATGMLFKVNTATNTFKGGIAYERTTSSGRGSIHFLNNSVSDSSSATLANAVMTINNSGNVGIGTTSPGSSLHVAGSYQAAVSALTTNTTLDATHQVVTVDASGGARTITLPDCVAGILGRTYRIKKIDSSANTVTLARTGSDDTFDGATSYNLTTQYQSVNLICVSTTLWGIY